MTSARFNSSISDAAASGGSPQPKTRGRRRPVFTRRLERTSDEPYPDLMKPHPVLDAFETNTLSSASSTSGAGLPLAESTITYYNSPPPFPRRSAKSRSFAKKELQERRPIEVRDEHSYLLIRKRVVHQTGKGKMASVYYGVVVGNGKGIVGYGDAKSLDSSDGVRKATNNAIKNADALELFEGRTIWTDMKVKFGATELHLRPRPRGFGLMCNPYVHQVCKAAGIKDISAKVHGSRNPMAVIKATLLLLHSGGAPLGMGDGIGGPGRREEKQQGIKSLQTMERERGRSFVEGGMWI